MNFSAENPLHDEIRESIAERCRAAEHNLDWLKNNLHPYFFITMREEVEAIGTLATGLSGLGENRRLLLADSDKKLILATPDRPGTLYETLRGLQERDISYAHIAHSYGNLPGSPFDLELQRFEFDRKSHGEISEAMAAGAEVPMEIADTVAEVLRRRYPLFDFAGYEKLLSLLWLNNESYVRISPPDRLAQILWLFQQGNSNGGVFLDVEETQSPDGGMETRVLFAVGNPPQKDFLLQTMEVFNRLDIGVKRTYCLTISNGVHSYFLGTFYARTREDGLVDKGSELFNRLRAELYNTQLLSTASYAYKEFVANKVMTGEEATFINACIAFCHTNLAHNNQRRFDLEGVMRAFHTHPDMALQLARLFRTRFEPGLVKMEDREAAYRSELEETTAAIENYNTGRRDLDEFRRTIFRCALTFIRHCLKTNFFVLEKHALAFRLDPAYLAELGEEFTADLPSPHPFRVTFFFGRFGAGYHVGFSDIARGGWRTIVTRSRDDYATCANSLLREVYILAHTQHLKNKDIYEGGSKMAIALDASRLADEEQVTQRLYKLQYGMINAFFDIFVTEKGVARHPRVVDYYREEEAIELGPDENMHDPMVEAIARQSVKRNYLLGIGVISSKKVGINHKEYGVTSAGVVKFAEITMAELGIDISKNPFSVKFTGGPNGDVAGNAMRLLLERCARVQVKLILDGTGALYDPQGADREALGKVVLSGDVEAFDPAALTPGGFVLYRNQSRVEGLRKLFRKMVATEEGLEERWVSLDEFNREFNSLTFTVPADLFIPAGGRPETVDEQNWSRFLDEEGKPTARAIVEGANSFITPAARVELQKKGVVLMRDASANKCGVISSSYEIIANLMLSQTEFLACKENYVADVIEILDKRAADEARLIFRRHKEPGNELSYTELSYAISTEINGHYARLFDFFRQRPHLCEQPLYRNAILAHLPRILREDPKIAERIDALPAKYKYAIVASEIASSIVYLGDRDAEFEQMITAHLSRVCEPVEQRLAS